MNELHLFAGVGGGILGSLLLEHRIVCAVELDPYCRCVLIQRQNDGHLPFFPIWDDVRTFNGKRWRGIVDVVSGGFPCNNISPAGDRTGIYGAKSSLWFEMRRVIRELRPRYVFVENSAQLVRNGLDVVLKGLVESRYDAEWCVLGASDVGAPHFRKRCWILGKLSENVENTDCQSRQTGRAVDKICRKTLTEDRQNRQANQTFRPSWWEIEPRICRVVDELPHRLHRLKALGNAQVPLCAAVAWKFLYERINEQ